MRYRSTEPSRARATVLAVALLLCVAGCGGAGKTQSSPGSSVPAYVSEPFTPEEQLVGQGARLVVSDGCSACHLNAAAHGVAPSFASFAGHPVTLTDGRRAIVNERFVSEALLHPGRTQIKGYDAASMLAATKRLDLPEHPQQVAALAAFIEQIGPEPG